MPQTSRDIQRRLKTVRSVKKITRAMELVAAAKMRKSVNRVLQSRAYAEAAWQTVLGIIPKVDPSEHPLLADRSVKRAAVVVISSNRGLCGAFNLNVASKALGIIEKEKWDPSAVDFITFGSVGARILNGMKKHIVADYPKADITASVGDIVPMTRKVIDDFSNGTYDEIVLAYTDFKSSLHQEARIRHLLPLSKPSRFLGTIGEGGTRDERKIEASEYLFEPSKRLLLQSVLPRLIELQMYQAVLESEASEHSARMLAMHNATDAATDMIDSLTLAYNQARQAGITAELAEISAASVAIQAA